MTAYQRVVLTCLVPVAARAVQFYARGADREVTR